MKRLFFLALVLCLTSATGPICAQEPVTSSSPDDIFRVILEGIQTQDLQKFTTAAEPQFKVRVNSDIISRVHDQFIDRMTAGYTTQHLGELKYGPTIVHLYKIQFKDGSNDVLGKLVLHNGKVAGVSLLPPDGN